MRNAGNALPDRRVSCGQQRGRVVVKRGRWQSCQTLQSAAPKSARPKTAFGGNKHDVMYCMTKGADETLGRTRSASPSPFYVGRLSLHPREADHRHATEIPRLHEGAVKRQKDALITRFSALIGLVQFGSVCKNLAAIYQLLIEICALCRTASDGAKRRNLRRVRGGLRQGSGAIATA